MANDRLVWFDPAAATPELADAGRGFRHPNGLGGLAVWGDRIVFHSEKGDLFARPLADTDAAWVRPHPPPTR